MSPSYVLAADIGGTKIATAVVSSTGEILQMSKSPTSLNGPSALLDQITTMLQADLKRAGVDAEDVLGLGVGIPAVIDEHHKVIVWAPNLPGWENIPLHDELVKRLGLPVHIEYDGHAAVLGEWWLGAGRGYRSVVFVIVGTGIGGGMILDGRLYRGASRLAGAAGWFVLGTQRASDKYARQLGHWESLAAGPGIARYTVERLRQSDQPSLLRSLSLSTSEPLTARMVFDAARQGDPLADEIARYVGEVLGVGIANIVSLVNPEVVIIGGGVGTQADLFIDRIREVVIHNAQPISAQAVQIVPSQLGESAGLLGAAKAMLLLYEQGIIPIGSNDPTVVEYN
ncbi:MAG: ROK family protein [Anaerolineae bacterium]|nr:ROK family protein [Anaerolineae bacterium]